MHGGLGRFRVVVGASVNQRLYQLKEGKARGQCVSMLGGRGVGGGVGLPVFNARRDHHAPVLVHNLYTMTLYYPLQ
jgi:hypothetical protein